MTLVRSGLHTPHRDSAPTSTPKVACHRTPQANAGTADYKVWATTGLRPPTTTIRLRLLEALQLSEYPLALQILALQLSEYSLATVEYRLFVALKTMALKLSELKLLALKLSEPAHDNFLQPSRDLENTPIFNRVAGMGDAFFCMFVV